MSKLVALVQTTTATLKMMQAQLRPSPVKAEITTEVPPDCSQVVSADSAVDSTEMNVETESATDNTDCKSPQLFSHIAMVTPVSTVDTATTLVTAVDEATTQVDTHVDHSIVEPTNPLKDCGIVTESGPAAVMPIITSSISTSTPIAVSSTTNTTTEVPLVLPTPSDIAALEHQLSLCGNNLREAFDRLSRSRVEEDSCSKKAQLEESRMEETIEWMLAMQGVLWPENVPDRELGRPILPEQPPYFSNTVTKPEVSGLNLLQGHHSRESMSHEESEIEDEAANLVKPEIAQDNGPPTFVFFAPVPTAQPLTTLSSCSKSKDLLSYGMRNALDAARMLGILEVVDVDTTMEAFRWMAWCFRCLHTLRIPPATYTLKRLIDCCKPLKLADERIVRAVGGILSRSQAWKSKARRLIYGGQIPPSQVPSSVTKKLDTSKLHVLIAEGGMVPVTSALKDHLVRTWDLMIQSATSLPSTVLSSLMQPEQHQSVPPAVAAGGKPKRVPKIAANVAVPGVAPFTMTTMTSEVMNSSDEEDLEGEYNIDHISSMTSSSAAQEEAFSLPSSEQKLLQPRIARKKRIPNTSNDGIEIVSYRDCVRTPLSPSMWASLPSLWPPSITVRQVLTESKRQGPLSSLANRNGNSSKNNNKSSSSGGGSSSGNGCDSGNGSGSGSSSGNGCGSSSGNGSGNGCVSGSGNGSGSGSGSGNGCGSSSGNGSGIGISSDSSNVSGNGCGSGSGGGSGSITDIGFNVVGNCGSNTSKSAGCGDDNRGSKSDIGSNDYNEKNNCPSTQEEVGTDCAKTRQCDPNDDQPFGDGLPCP